MPHSPLGLPTTLPSNLPIPTAIPWPHAASSEIALRRRFLVDQLTVPPGTFEPTPEARLKRRQFLEGASLLVAAAGGATRPLGERSARAFGEIPAGAADAAAPPDLRAQSILRYPPLRGVSQYQSSDRVDTFGKSDNTGLVALSEHRRRAASGAELRITGPAA